MKKTKPYLRVLYGILALFMLAAAVFMAMDAAENFSSTADREDAEYFDPYTDDGEQHVLGFNLLSDSFATFALGENHGCYFAIDNNDYGIFLYIVCMSNDQFADYQDVYDFTFSDEGWEDSPGYGAIYGYPMEIDAELRDYAIEYFNYFWDEEVLNEENFSDLVGDYYLDATYQPGSRSEAVESLIFAVVFLALSCLFIYLTFRRDKIVPAEGVMVSEGADAAAAEASDFGGAVPAAATTPAAAATAPPPGELPRELNRGMGLLGAVLGALIGGVVWVVLYRAGYIAGLAGYISVLCAIKGYEKLAGGIGRSGIIASSLIALVVIVLSNCVGISWIIADAVNETNPGRATIGYILRNFGDMMDYLDLWGSFIGDLVIGLLLGVLASFGPIRAAIRAEKNQSAHTASQNQDPQ